MARMLPPFIDESTRSSAERRVFGAIKEQLSNEWTVLHSLGSTLHDRKPWAEIDFVLVGPPGVFCLEVKGGRIARRRGEWEFTDRFGHVATKREGPFEQVGPAAAQIYRFLSSRLPDSRSSIVGYGVVTPDVRFDVVGPDIEAQIVYDERDTIHPFEHYLTRLSEYWNERLQYRRPLSTNLRERVVQLLRPDFDVQPSLASRLRNVERELVRFTEEQYRVLDGLVDNPRVLVRGAAGTGKTLLAVEEARRRAAIGKRVLLCCFNRMLADHLRRSADLKGVEVYHYHGLLSELIKEAGLERSLPDATEDQLFRVFMPAVALEAILKEDILARYDVLVIDEGQDLLLDDYVEVLDALLVGGMASGSWRIFYDPYQDLFEGTNLDGATLVRKAVSVQYRLTMNCRNTQPIATTAALVGGVLPGDAMQTSGPDVEWIWYRDDQHQRRALGRRLSRLISTDHVDPRSIVVLTRRLLKSSGLADGLVNCPLPIHDIRSSRTKSIPHSTVTAFKGLEAEVVVLADVQQLTDSAAMLEHYVAASRARGLLIVALHQSLQDDYQELAERLGERIAAH